MVSKDMFEVSDEEAKPKMMAALGAEEVLCFDPGSNGGYAFWHHSGIRTADQPKTEGDVLTLLGEWTDLCGENKKVAVIEHQTGVVGPKMKVSAASMFTFGSGYGFTRGILVTLGWKLIEVRPQKWQSALSLGTKKDHGGNTPWKNHLKAKAQQLYPGTKVTLKTADALLIMEWYMRSKNIAPMASFFS